MMIPIRFHIYFLAICLWFSVGAGRAETSPDLIKNVMREYQAGNYDRAAALLADDLAKNPEDGVSHYYLGLVKQKMGDDCQALNELEWAARLCPPEMIQSLTQQAINSKDGKLPKVPRIITPKADWFGMFGNSMSQMFGGAKPEPQVTDTGDVLMPPPLLFGSMDDLMKQGKQIVKSGVKKAQELHKGKGYKSWAADVMPMDDMMDLVDKSKSINKTRWASHSDGLSKFRQSPENTSDWDFWIQRYTRAFQHILTRYLATDAREQVRGKAACIFSIDKRGNLRGHIYASTGDGVLNSCLLKTIQAMNHSRILEFPPNSKITGFNFRMTWDYGKILSYVRAYREYKREQEKRALEEQIALQTEALLKQKKEQEDKAKAEKLKALREKQLARAKARLAEINSVRTEVVGQILPAVGRTELRAVAMSLADPDLKKMPNVPTDQKIDPFGQISDQEIMSWPDISR